MLSSNSYSLVQNHLSVVFDFNFFSKLPDLDMIYIATDYIECVEIEYQICFGLRGFLRVLVLHFPKMAVSPKLGKVHLNRKLVKLYET
jgi:hypothetical protein